MKTSKRFDIKSIPTHTKDNNSPSPTLSGHFHTSTFLFTFPERLSASSLIFVPIPLSSHSSFEFLNLLTSLLPTSSSVESLYLPLRHPPKDLQPFSANITSDGNQIPQRRGLSAVKSATSSPPSPDTSEHPSPLPVFSAHHPFPRIVRPFSRLLACSLAKSLPHVSAAVLLL